MDNEEELMRQLANNTKNQIKNKAKQAGKAVFQMFKKQIIIGVAVILLIILVVLLTVSIMQLVIENNGNTTDGSYVTIGKDYVVNTSISEEDIIVTDATLLENAIKSLGYSDSAKTNLINNIPAFLGIQNEYNVNAVFGMAVTIVESSAGTSWAAIDANTYNWCSMTAGSSWTGPTYRNPNSSNERTWRVYSSFSEATYDFGKVISNSTYYFGGEHYTVSSIAVSYCNAQWGVSVIDRMTEIFEACGIDTSKYNNISVTGNAIVDKAAQLYMIMYQEEYGYNQSYHSSTPPVSSKANCSDSLTTQHGEKGTSGRHTKLTDCSGFINWVLYELGIGKFTLATDGWINFDPKAYGLENICTVYTYSSTENIDPSDLKPGDIVVKRNVGNGSGHVHIIAAIDVKGNTYVYDAGTEENWMSHNGKMFKYNMWKDSHYKMTVIRFNGITSVEKEE